MTKRRDHVVGRLVTKRHDHVVGRLVTKSNVVITWFSHFVQPRDHACSHKVQPRGWTFSD